MEKAPGALEALAIQLAKVLAPLEDRLTAREIRNLFAELGLQFPVELETKTALLNALQDSIQQVLQLPDLVSDVIEAVNSDDLDAIVEQTKALLVTIKGLIESIDTIATEVQNLSDAFPDISEEDIQSFAAALPDRLLAYFITNHIDTQSPVITEFLEFWGIIQRTEKPGDPTDPAKPPFTLITLNLRRAIDVLESPSNLARTLYKWGAPDFDGADLLQVLSKSFARLNVPAILDTSATPPVLDFVFAQLAARTDISPPGLSLVFTTNGNLPTVSLQDGPWKVDLGLDFDLPTEGELVFQPDGSLALQTTDGTVSGKAFLRASGASPDPNLPFLLFGRPEGSRLQAQEINAAFETELSFDAGAGKSLGELRFEGAIRNGELIITLAGADGFLTSILPADGFKAVFEFTIGFSSETGFYFDGSSALEINIPVHASIGVLELQSVTLGVGFEDGTLPMDLGTSLKFSLGPLVAVIQEVGLTALFSAPEDGGNLGPLNLDIGFKPPTAIGLSIDSAGFKGGGFLEYEREEERYVGMLELEFQETIAIKAIGLLTTRLPDGRQGFSLLIIITAEFTPIQLGFGFTLNGVGGLLGVHRTAVVERLRTGVRDNTLNSILFPTDIVANADRIISDLRQVFPPQENRFVFGPMAKIGWGTPTLITLDLGLMIELPEPIRILILGALRAVVPDEETPILELQVNFLGVIDFENERLAFDASIFDSRLLAFPLSGDMAVRLYWGADPNFLLTVGGFHPAYEPPPMQLPQIRRLTLSLLKGNNPRLTMETYYAVTSNTVQVGAKLELYAAAGKFNVYGFLAFDALFQFNPFYFIAQISAMLALRAGSSSIASISLSFELQGPTPWSARGTAKLKLFWFLTVKVRFSKTFGEERDTTLPDVAVIPLLEEALRANGNWQAQLPPQRQQLVTFKQIEPTDDSVIADPFGILEISQKIVPLNVTIDKFGNQLPQDGSRFSIGGISIGTEAQSPAAVKEFFAPAQFFEKSDSEKLSSKSFEKYDNGVRLTDSEQLQGDYYSRREVEYEVFYIDSQREELQPIPWFELILPDVSAFALWTTQGSIARSPLSFAQTAKSALAPEQVAVRQEGFGIVHTGDLTLFDESSMAASEAEATQRLRDLLRDNPELEDDLQVVPEFEVQSA